MTRLFCPDDRTSQALPVVEDFVFFQSIRLFTVGGRESAVVLLQRLAPFVQTYGACALLTLAVNAVQEIVIANDSTIAVAVPLDATAYLVEPVVAGAEFALAIDNDAGQILTVANDAEANIGLEAVLAGEADASLAMQLDASLLFGLLIDANAILCVDTDASCSLELQPDSAATIKIEVCE